jgi:hypothetical protein
MIAPVSLFVFFLLYGFAAFGTGWIFWFFGKIFLRLLGLLWTSLASPRYMNRKSLKQFDV